MKILWENDDWPGAVVDPGITCLNWIPSANKPGSGLLAAGMRLSSLIAHCCRYLFLRGKKRDTALRSNKSC